MTRICDGAGDGNSARVNENKRLHVHAVTIPEEVNSSAAGNSFGLHSGSISLSAAGTLIYIKNNEASDLIVDAIIIAIATGNVTELPEAIIIRNPTGGDLITDATTIAMNTNINFSSSKELTADTFKGKSGGTITGGQDHALIFVAQGGRTLVQRGFVIPKGSSIAVKFDPKLGSGSMKAYCDVICHLRDKTSED